jgi:hypothetical protein
MRVTSSDTPNPDTRQPTTCAATGSSPRWRVRTLTASSTALVPHVLSARLLRTG